MNAVFFYDKTFDGLLSAVFQAYSTKRFPDRLLKVGDVAPMFIDERITVITDPDQAGRVWTGLLNKTDATVRNMLGYVWLSEISGSDELLFRYICKTFDSKHTVAWNFGDADVLELTKIARKVAHEALYIKQFVRFQKSADGIYVAPIHPEYNALPLTIAHFSDRFADQQWVIYDTKRKYGYYYNLHEAVEITLADDNNLLNGRLNDTAMDDDEKLFQQLWKSYFKAMAIKERLNPRLHRHNMPTRFWRYLTEKRI
ncbi:MAG: TIGR03915 family putative DNA repair protein [Bacteroidales bacterium]|jgi:probable DNA metabolism protein|nr:TIGR03915 family putative DNA repair protein [Bacteroidales bacterium]